MISIFEPENSTGQISQNTVVFCREVYLLGPILFIIPMNDNSSTILKSETKGGAELSQVDLIAERLILHFET